jgi:hypothetical protein
MPEQGNCRESGLKHQLEAILDPEYHFLDHKDLQKPIGGAASSPSLTRYLERTGVSL